MFKRQNKAIKIKPSKIKQNEALMKIPFLGYFFKKLKENRQVIETTLKTGKETKGEIKERYYLWGFFKIITGKTFNILKIKKK